MKPQQALKAIGHVALRKIDARYLLPGLVFAVNLPQVFHMGHRDPGLTSYELEKVA